VINHSDPEGMDHQLFERKRDFLIHMVQTYPALNPYLKGIHGTIDSWRKNRDENGFRVGETKRMSRDGSLKSPQSVAHNEPPEPMHSDPEDPLAWDDKFGNFNLSRFGDKELEQPPSKVHPVKRLEIDLTTMLLLTESEDAPRRNVRPGQSAHAIYGFGNASKDGFRGLVEVEGKGIVWRSGTWNHTMREESSNYREFSNLVEVIESLVKKGTLKGHELFMFTDNLTRESAFFKGTLTSEKM
jgi:hypothetical protein